MDYTANPESKRTYDFKVIFGPSFKDGLPDHEEWHAFKENILDENGLALAELWYKKAEHEGGVPLRKDFSFEDFVKFGSNIYIAKINDDNIWETTFCGGDIVNKIGFDATGKTLDDFGSPETLEFWLKNLQSLTGESKVYAEFYTLEFPDNQRIHCTAINFPLKSGDKDFPDINLNYETFTNENLLYDD